MFEELIMTGLPYFGWMGTILLFIAIFIVPADKSVMMFILWLSSAIFWIAYAVYLRVWSLVVFHVMLGIVGIAGIWEVTKKQHNPLLEIPKKI